jgi:hypothetical protein
MQEEIALLSATTDKHTRTHRDGHRDRHTQGLEV